jgi:tyrosyl-tRNA synthetase
MAFISPQHGGLVFPTPYNAKIESKEVDEINKKFSPEETKLSVEERFNLCMSIGEEVLTPENLKAMLSSKKQFICYDGFEPSGRLHIAQGIQKAINVNKITKAGGVFIFWIADWFAMMNHKMGGDLEKIKVMGKYFIEVWKAVGMDMKNVKFLWASDEITKNSSTYWPMVLNIAMSNTISRVKKCSQIMGREESDELSVSQLIYPCMQCADIFHLNTDVCQLGLDQRKVNVLALEYCDKIKKEKKPVIISHHMLLGLTGKKMSKSDPDSAIFLEDSEAEVKRKIKKAYCPEKEIKSNPILEYNKYIIFEKFDKIMIDRTEKNGGNLEYTKYADLEKDFQEGKLHPNDLKPNTAKYINMLIEPIRQHFINDPNAKALLEQVMKIKAEEKEEASIKEEKKEEVKKGEEKKPENK